MPPAMPKMPAMKDVAQMVRPRMASDTRVMGRRWPSTVPEQPAGAHQIDRAERQDEGARPLAETMVGHALDQEGRERGAGHRDQDGEHIGPWRLEGLGGAKRAEIERAQHVTEGLGDGLGGERRLAVERALLEEH